MLQGTITLDDFTFKFIAHFRTVIYSYMAINTWYLISLSLAFYRKIERHGYRLSICSFSWTPSYKYETTFQLLSQLYLCNVKFLPWASLLSFLYGKQLCPMDLTKVYEDHIFTPINFSHNSQFKFSYNELF